MPFTLNQFGIESVDTDPPKLKSRFVIGEGEWGTVYSVVDEAQSVQGPVSQVVKDCFTNVSIVQGNPMEDGVRICSPCASSRSKERMKKRIRQKYTKPKARPAGNPKKSKRARRAAAEEHKKAVQSAAPSFDKLDVCQMVVTPTTIESDNSLNEMIVHRAVSMLVEQEITPHVVQCLKGTWYPRTLDVRMYLERFDFTFCKFADSHNRWFNSDRLAHMLFPVFHVLHVLQTMLKFKHYDLHDENVALTRIEETTTFRGQQLCTYKWFKYNVHDKVYYVRNLGFLLKLSDFGFASMEYEGKRVGRVDMDEFNDKPEKHGEWTIDWRDNEKGYDIQYFTGDYITPTLKTVCKRDQQFGKFMREVHKVCRGTQGQVTKNNRPRKGSVSEMAPSQVIENIFFGPSSKYDLTQPPTDGPIADFTNAF